MHEHAALFTYLICACIQIILDATAPNFWLRISGLPKMTDAAIEVAWSGNKFLLCVKALASGLMWPVNILSVIFLRKMVTIGIEEANRNAEPYGSEQPSQGD
jgi:hypothetical protein